MQLHSGDYGSSATILPGASSTAKKPVLPLRRNRLNVRQQFLTSACTYKGAVAALGAAASAGLCRHGPRGDAVALGASAPAPAPGHICNRRLGASGGPSAASSRPVVLASAGSSSPGGVDASSHRSDGSGDSTAAPVSQSPQPTASFGASEPQTSAHDASGHAEAAPSAAEGAAHADSAAPSGEAAAVTADAAATPEGTAAAPAVQSEYVEEYETVYETETEEAAAPAVAAAPSGSSKEEVVEAAEAGAALAETEATAVAGTEARDSATQQQQPTAVTLMPAPPPLLSPYAARLAAVSYADGAAGGGALGGTSVGGWALAAALLLAIRLSREAADSERMDLQALQARQAEGRALDAELRSKRRAYLEAERRRLEEEAAKRVAEAKAKQEEDARAAAERQRQWQEEAAREEQRMKEAQAAAKRVYEEREARMAQELAARLETERKLREEAEARRREEAEARKRAEAEAAARAAEARAAAAAAEAAARAAEAAARAETERRLKLASTWYTFAFRGRVVGRPAPPGTMVPVAAGGGATAALLRGPPTARLVLECSIELASVARTAPTLDASLVAAAATGSAGAADSVAAAGSDAAATAATLTVAAAQLAAPAAGAVDAAGGDAAAAGSSERPYESSAAAVEAAVELAGSAAAPIARLLMSSAWTAALSLQPTPGEALRTALVGQAGAGTAAPSDAAAGANAASVASRIDARAQGSGVQAAVTHADAGREPAAAAVASLAEAELRHWGRVAHLQLLASGRQVLCQLAPLLGPGERLEQGFECRLSRQVPPPLAALPADAAALAPAVAPSLERAVAAAAAGQLQRCVDIMDPLIAREEAAAAAGRDGAAAGAPLPALAVAALLYGELMEAAGYRPPPPPSPAATTDSSATDAGAAGPAAAEGNAGGSGSGGEAVAEAAEEGAASELLTGLEKLARHQLKERARGAPADSLTVTAQMLALVLPGGARHPVARILARLAEDNLSIGTRQALQIRKQRAALEAQAAAVLEQQRGSGRAGGALVVGPAGAADARGSLVPTPERLWASRNVANNLLRFGEPMAVGEAVRLLEEAVSVSRAHYGERHPAQLAVLLDLLGALAAEEAAPAAAEQDAAAAAAGSGGERKLPAAARRAAAATELLEIVQALCERYQAARDPLSCVLLLEAAVAEVQPALRRGGRNGDAQRALAAATELAGELMYALKPPEARTVMTARRDGALPRLLRRLGRDFSEELGAYAAGKRNRWLDAWNSGRPLPPLRP